MSTSNDILSITDDIEFLKAYQKSLKNIYKVLPELCYPQDFNTDSDEILETPPQDERAARLADANGFDGSLFRNLTPDDDPTSVYSMRHLRKRIETIPRIIESIEKSNSTKQEWHINNGQVFYMGEDLRFPTGNVQEVMKKLVNAQGKTVCYEDLTRTMTLDECRHYIMYIRNYLKKNKILYKIKTQNGEGYLLHKQ